ncbi:MAG: cytochrome c [Dongiaceae bacterium]
MLMCSRLAFAAALIAGGAGAAFADSLTADDGRWLAREYCAACHRTAKDQPTPPAVAFDTGSGIEEVAAPSFARIARADRGEAELRRLILLPHYPMREQQLLPDELDAILAYILSLRATEGATAGW